MTSFVASAVLFPHFVYSLIHLAEHFPDSTLCNAYCREITTNPIFQHQVIINETKLGLQQGKLVFSNQTGEIENLRRFDSNSVAIENVYLETKTVSMSGSQRVFLPSTYLEYASYSNAYRFSYSVAGAVSGQCVRFTDDPLQIAVDEPGCMVQFSFPTDVEVTFYELRAEDTDDVWNELLIVDLKAVEVPYSLQLSYRPRFALDGAIASGILGIPALLGFLILTCFCCAESCSATHSCREFCGYWCVECWDDFGDDFSALP